MVDIRYDIALFSIYENFHSNRLALFQHLSAKEVPQGSPVTMEVAKRVLESAVTLENQQAMQEALQEAQYVVIICCSTK